MIRVNRYRIKNICDLQRQAHAVNSVWNYCNERQKEVSAWGCKALSGFELCRLTSGSNKALGIPARCIEAVCQQYARSRAAKKLPSLRYRGKRSLGWIPFKDENISQKGDSFRFNGRYYRVFLSRPIPIGARICDGGSFSQDARGRWYLNVAFEMPDAIARPRNNAVGIDLGLKDFATLTTGEKIKNPRHYRNLESALGKAQRARKKRYVRAIHAKIGNRRRDTLHKLSTRLVKQFDYIAVGNVSAVRLVKTSMAKSVNDVGWSSFRNMLRYKAITHGATFEEVNESGSTRVCSSCGCETGPKGVADLGIRQWVCVECGASHDRDLNSAINILVRSGHRTLVEGADSNGSAKLLNVVPIDTYTT